jgi:hypothetical protein
VKIVLNVQRTFAYIEFADPTAAEKAVQVSQRHMNGSSLDRGSVKHFSAGENGWVSYLSKYISSKRITEAAGMKKDQRNTVNRRQLCFVELCIWNNPTVTVESCLGSCVLEAFESINKAT